MGEEIWKLTNRGDIKALKFLKQMCRATNNWKTDEATIMAITFGIQLYFTETIAFWSAAFLDMHPWAHNQQSAAECMATTMKRFKHIRKTTENGSISMLKNPSERSCGSIRYGKLCKNIEDIKQMTVRMTQISHPVAVVDLLQTLCVPGVYDEKTNYKNLRLVRCVAEAMEWQWADTDACWKIWRHMSSHVTAKCKELMIWDYRDAIAVRDLLRRHSAKYSFADLICYVCLMT